MIVDRCTEQRRATLDEFYASIQDGYDGVYIGRTMLSLIAALRKHPDPRRVWGLTSHYHLGFLADDAASTIFVWVVASDPQNYFIEYRLPDEEAPWPDAYVKGTAQSEEEAMRMILLGMDKSKGWDKQMAVTVRQAVESDAESACNVVRQSITELCCADHRNDQDTLNAWLENKTVAMFERLINAESKSCVVALRNGQVCGFGHMNDSGEVGLLYVAPEARFLGASTLMLAWLEEQATRLGLSAIFLNSSLTARRFYEARGYSATADPRPGFGITSGWPMVKQLAL